MGKQATSQTAVEYAGVRIGQYLGAAVSEPAGQLMGHVIGDSSRQVLGSIV